MSYRFSQRSHSIKLDCAAYGYNSDNLKKSNALVKFWSFLPKNLKKQCGNEKFWSFFQTTCKIVNALRTIEKWSHFAHLISQLSFLFIDGDIWLQFKKNEKIARLMISPLLSIDTPSGVSKNLEDQIEDHFGELEH